MRKSILLLVAAGALAACNPSAENEAGGAESGVFPDLASASYRAEATITDERGQTIPVVLMRDGPRQRMEFTTAEGRSVIITNAETGESLILAEQGGRTYAMRATVDSSQFEDPSMAWGGQLAATATRTGGCSVAGQNGSQWTRSENGAISTACVTNDGIILRAAEGDRVVWETASVERGPQPASQFELPPGVQVMDMGNVGGMMDALKDR